MAKGEFPEMLKRSKCEWETHTQGPSKGSGVHGKELLKGQTRRRAAMLVTADTRRPPAASGFALDKHLQDAWPRGRKGAGGAVGAPLGGRPAGGIW